MNDNTFKIEDFIEFVKEYSYKDKDPLFSMNATVGELGELANVIKKKEYFEHFEEYKKQVFIDISKGKRVDFDTQMNDEMGDTLFYLFQLMTALGLNIQSVCKAQMDKIENQSKELDRKFIK